MPARQLDFQDPRTAHIFEETHNLGNWVANYDELLDRRQLLNQNQMLAADTIEFPMRPQYRVHHPELDPELRRQMFEEVEQTIGAADAYRESRRCLRCYRVYSVVTEQPIPEGAA